MKPEFKLSRLRNKRARQEDAIEREAARAELTPKQQIARLDKRLGVGEGAEKERARLEAMISAAKPAKKK